MSGPALVLIVAVGALVAAGTYLLLHRSLVRIVVGFVLLGHAANLALLLAGGPAAAPPVLAGGSPAGRSDPLPQAMALTAIVITFGVTAFLLALAYRSRILTGEDEAQDDVEDRRVGREPYEEGIEGGDERDRR